MVRVASNKARASGDGGALLGRARMAGERVRSGETSAGAAGVTDGWQVPATVCAVS